MHSRSIRSLVALLATLSLFTVLTPAAGAATVNASVTIRESGYSPTTVTIRPGERVIWFNSGTRDHTVTSDGGNQIASGTITPGEELAIEFSQPGTYHYHSAFLRDHMRGTVVVAGTPAAAAVATVTVTVDTASAPFPITISGSAQDVLGTSSLFVRRQDDRTWWSVGLIAVAGLTAAAVVIALLAFGRRPGSDPA